MFSNVVEMSEELLQRCTVNAHLYSALR